MDTSDLAGKTALVTGAGSGIGRETALLLGARGADLVICDLDEGGLAETEKRLVDMGRSVFAQRVDVADRGHMRAFAGAVHDRVQAVDLLVNNAGVGLAASFADSTLDDWDWIVGINLMGVVHGCHFFVPKMVERGKGGHVVNVSSAAGFVAAEPLCAYATTKFAVFGLSEALQQELHRSGIGLTVICPGIINTPITRSARGRGVFDRSDARQEMVEGYERRNYGPERVARNILKAVQRDRVVAPVSPEAWGMWFLKRLSPALVRWIGRTTTERQLRQFGG